MESDERLCRVSESSSKRIIITRISDLKDDKYDAMQGLAMLVEDLQRHNGLKDGDELSNNEEGLIQAFRAQTLDIMRQDYL